MINEKMGKVNATTEALNNDQEMSRLVMFPSLNNMIQNGHSLSSRLQCGLFGRVERDGGGGGGGVRGPSLWRDHTRKNKNQTRIFLYPTAPCAISEIGNINWTLLSRISSLGVGGLLPSWSFNRNFSILTHLMGILCSWLRSKT